METNMTFEEALNTLVALAYCSVPELSCEDCPFEGGGDCRASWTDGTIVQAVNVIKNKRNVGEQSNENHS